MESFISVNKSKDITDVSKLNEGMVIKNYKEMCSILNEPIKTGGARNSQLDRWRRYFEWSKDKQKYIILDVYKNPLPKELSDNAIYAKFFEIIIMAALSKMDDDVYHFFPNQFFEMIGIVSQNYKYLNGYDALYEMFGENGSVDNSITVFGSRAFNNIAGKRINDIVDCSLRALDRSGLFHYKKQYALKTTPWNIAGGFVAASDVQEKMIVAAEQRAMRDFGIADKWIGYHSKISKKFINRINEYINLSDHNYYGALRWFTIIYTNPPQDFWDIIINRTIRQLRQVVEIENDQILTVDYLVKMSKQVLNDMVCSSIEQSYKQKKIRMNSEMESKIGSKEWGDGIDLTNYNKKYIITPQFQYEFNALLNRFVRAKTS